MWSNIIERATEACQQDRSGKSLETSPTGWRRYQYALILDCLHTQPS